MAPSKKRKAAVEPPIEPVPKRGRSKKTVETTASSTRPNRVALALASAPRSTRSSSGSTPIKNVKKASGRSKSSIANGAPVKAETKAVAKPRANSSKKVGTAKDAAVEKAELGELKEASSTKANGRRQANVSVEVSAKERQSLNHVSDDEADEDNDGPSYWLMKAEPDSRIEKGKDVKFSIDDLKAATAPEAWDGVRNPSGEKLIVDFLNAAHGMLARNNMRAMMKGDMAFFYHSNCKVPGIVGTMEVVQEHSIDETAFDPEHPYYDEKSTREKPKWDVVHVEYRQKFPEIIKLKELQKFAKPGGALENLQTLRQSRLSVSKVTKRQWDFIMDFMDSDDVATASAQQQPQMTA